MARKMSVTSELTVLASWYNVNTAKSAIVVLLSLKILLLWAHASNFLPQLLLHAFELSLHVLSGDKLSIIRGISLITSAIITGSKRSC